LSEPGINNRFRLRDAVEVIVGGSIMAFPVAVTEEVWNLGAELGLARVLWFALFSLIVLSITIYVLHGHAEFRTHREFVNRVASTYGLTLLISAMLLFGVDRLDLMGEPLTGLKRVILVAFPASFAATAIDSFGDRSNR